MSENSSLDRRYSFNIAQVSPVAESTHLNGSSFSWGLSMSPEHRSNSTICLNNFHSNNTKTILSSNAKNKTKIDARIAADVQSKGLASRIVKYHDSGTRLNRSMSAHNIYNKPGQFPAVTLKKTDLPYRATKQELSMIHIAPPEKSTSGNTISSLLRSNSVIGLQKRTEDTSRENRPILHPPPTENDMAPTRSVLDVLKEISRKRINSDDLETDETSKKYCNHVDGDFVDTGAVTMSVDVSNCVSPGHRFKRQRDCNTPNQCARLSESKTSPEQAKKRLCNYNNDITSSLSSSVKSIFCKEKRLPCYLNQTTTKAKIQRENQHNSQADIRYEHLANNLKNVETIKPITPLPATPCTEYQSNNDISPQRATESLYNVEDKTISNSIKAASKPRLTLFNKNYNEITESNKAESVENNTDDIIDFDECAGIPFVKPKKISSLTGVKNPVIERTQKSKLALMLSGLRGELFQNYENDELDSTKEMQEKNEDNKMSSIINEVKSVSKSIHTISPSLPVASSICEKNHSSSGSKTDLQSVNTIVSEASPLVGLKLTPPKSMIKNENTFDVNAKKSTENYMKPDLPVLGGFSFSTNKNMSTMLSATNVKSPKNSNTTSDNTSESNNINNCKQSNQSPTKIMNKNFNNSSEFSFNIQTTNNNILPLTAISDASPILNTTNASQSSKSSVANAIPPTLTSNILTPIIKEVSVNNFPNLNKTFNFFAPSTSSTSNSASTAPITFNYLSSTSATNTTPSNTLSVVSTPSISNLTSTSSFILNTPNQSKGIEITNSSSGVTSGSFSFGLNSNAPIAKSNNESKVKPLISLFSIGSESKTQQSSLVENNESKSVNPKEKPETNSNTMSLLGTTTSTTALAATNNCSQKSIFDSTNNTSTSLYSTTSAKTTSQSFEANVGKISVLEFGSHNANKGLSTPFSFSSKPAIVANTENPSTITGGFSFGLPVQNSSESVTFGLNNKANASSNTLNNNTDAISTSTLQNKTFMFGSTTNKPDSSSTNIFISSANKPSENAGSQGGFSFGSPVAQKKTTFSFNSFSESNVSANNSTTGFAFGGVAPPKPTEISNYKPFSLNTHQPQAQTLPVSNSSSSTSNIFSFSGASKTTPPAFSFSSGNPTNSQSTVQATTNIFAPPSSNITAGPGERPIRRATRRLQK